jgi:hypothetical protein
LLAKKSGRRRGVAPPLGDQVVAVIDEQLQLPQPLLLGTRPIEARLAQRRPCDRKRVDGIRLAAAAAAAPLGCSQPRRHPHHLLTCLEQQPLQAATDMPAVLKRPQPFSLQRPCPAQHSAFDRTVPASELSTELVDGDRRQRVLVHVHSDHDH